MSPARCIYRDGYHGSAVNELPKELQSFCFVRHGLTDANVKGVAQGQMAPS